MKIDVVADFVGFIISKDFALKESHDFGLPTLGCILHWDVIPALSL
jgi:hypothetical protein